MRSIITGIVVAFVSVLSFIGFTHNSYPVFYDRNGQLTNNQVKIWADTTTPSTANGFSIDISSAGFSVIKEVTITPANNTTSITSMPLVVIQTISTTAIVVNILTQNNATTTILGITVLSGSPLQSASSTAGMKLNVQVEGY